MFNLFCLNLVKMTSERNDIKMSGLKWEHKDLD